MSAEERKGSEPKDKSRTSSGKRKALIIAVSKYEEQSGLQHLHFCKNDGEAMHHLLVQQQYEIPDKWKLIGRVSGRKMRDSIIDFFFKSAKPGDTLFFYFSGHGVPDAYGDHFLASSDIDQKIPDEHGYDFIDLENAMKKSAARNIVTALDCCFSGAARSGKSGGELATEARGVMDRVFEEGSGRCVLASSLDGQSSYPMDDNEYSRFTYYLLLGLKGGSGAAVNTKGHVTPYTLSNYVYNNIPFLNEQKPITKTAMSGDIVIASYPEWAEPSEEDEKRSDFMYQLLRDGFIEQFNLARKGFLDLHDRDFQRRNLQNANLAGLNLSGVNMREANLQGADLSNSNLAGALLEFADLRNANLNSSKLEGASLEYALMHGASVGTVTANDPLFRGADFRDLPAHPYAKDSKSIFDLTAVPARNVEVNGYNVRYLAYENPPFRNEPEPTIMLHGLAGFADTWLLMLPTLSKYLRLVVPDMIGFGYSDKPLVKYDLDFFMKFIVGLIEKLSLGRVNIVGMSFGARLATEFAIRFPQMLNKLVLCSPVFVPRFFNATVFANVVFRMDYKAFFRTFVDDKYFLGDLDAGQVAETSAKIFAEMITQPELRNSYLSALSELRKFSDLHGRLSKIFASTLIVWGENDKISSVSKAERFREIPKSELVVIKDCGHYVCLQSPVEFSKAIIRHLTSI